MTQWEGNGVHSLNADCHQLENREHSRENIHRAEYFSHKACWLEVLIEQ